MSEDLIYAIRQLNSQAAQRWADMAEEAERDAAEAKGYRRGLEEAREIVHAELCRAIGSEGTTLYLYQVDRIVEPIAARIAVLDALDAEKGGR